MSVRSTLPGRPRSSSVDRVRRARTSASSDAALLESMSAKLQYSWDRYITFIHEILLLTGGTILVLLNGMLGSNRSDDMEFAGLGIGALVAAVLGMFAGMGWRLTSQFFMDREVFGAREDVQRYFEVCGIRSVSDYHDKYYGERTFRAWRVLFSVCSYASIASLLLAWILGGFFVAQNAG